MELATNHVASYNMTAFTGTPAPLPSTTDLFDVGSGGTLIDSFNTSLINTSPNTDVTTEREPLSPEQWIIVLLTPLTVGIGTIGNALCVAVLLRAKFRVLSINIHLLSLAAADTAFLWTNSMTRNFIKICFDINYSVMSDESCRAYVYILYVSKCLSAWFTVAVTIERLLVVLFPYRARSLAKRKRAFVVVAIVTLVVFGVYAFLPFLYHVTWDERRGEYKCKMIKYYKDRQVDVILKSLDLTVYSLLPTIILSLSNSVLVYKLVQSSRFRRANTTNDRHELDHTARRLTITLTLVSTCFLVFTLPMSSFLLHAQIYTSVANFDIYYRSFYVLELLNSAINFILYCASGPGFRAELKLLTKNACNSKLCGECGSTSKESSSTKNSTCTWKTDLPNGNAEFEDTTGTTMVWTTSTGSIVTCTKF